MDRTRRRIATGVLAVMLAIALAGCGALDGLLDTTPPDSDVFTIAVGDCLDDGDVAAEVTTVPRVDCAAPHDSEVFASTEIDGEAFPGDAELEAQLTAFCQGAAFLEFVGAAYLDSGLSTGGYYPTAASWASGDRELLCTIWDEDGPTTGTLEGAERGATPTP